MKVKILATGNVEEFDASYATRLVDLGYAIPEEDRGAFRSPPEPPSAEYAEEGKKVEIETVDQVPEPKQAEEPKTETKPAKSRKSK